LIYKLEKLSDQRFLAKLLPSSSSGNSELASGIPNCATTPLPPTNAFRKPVQDNPLSLGIPRYCLWYGMDIFWNHLKGNTLIIHTYV